MSFIFPWSGKETNITQLHKFPQATELSMFIPTDKLNRHIHDVITTGKGCHRSQHIEAKKQSRLNPFYFKVHGNRLCQDPSSVLHQTVCMT